MYQRDPVAFVSEDKPHLWYNAEVDRWVAFRYMKVPTYGRDGWLIADNESWVRYTIGRTISECWDKYNRLAHGMTA